MHYYYFILAVLAVWRITHLLSNEDGPFDIVFRLRRALGNSFFGRLIDCFYCLSIWVSLPFAVWLQKHIVEMFVTWLAISGAACLLQKAVEQKKPPTTQFYEEEEQK